jgi:hypothetical protein
MTKSRKILLITILTLTCSLAIELILGQSVFEPGEEGSDEAAIRNTLQNACLIQLEAEFTFDPSEFSTVYIKDPHGGEMTDEALEQIRLIRQDPWLQNDQTGILDDQIK